MIGSADGGNGPTAFSFAPGRAGFSRPRWQRMLRAPDKPSNTASCMANINFGRTTAMLRQIAFVWLLAIAALGISHDAAARTTCETTYTGQVCVSEVDLARF